MNLDRSLILDIGLGIAVAVVYYLYGSSHTAPNQQLWYAVMLGLGVTLFARFFIRRFFLPDAPLTPEDLQKQLQRVESYLQKYPQLEQEQKITLLEQAGALAMALEQWPRVIQHYEELGALLEKETRENPEQKEELDRRWFHTQLAISFAFLQDGQKQRSFDHLERLQGETLASREPIFRLLLELFQARIISQDDPERGQAMLNDALQAARQGDYEEDALRLVASEWIELGQPEAAIELLQQAMKLAQSREDAIAETEVLYQLGYAYGAAKQLPQAARTLVLLTQHYVHSNFPTPQQIEQLRRTLWEQFGKRTFQDAYHDAEKNEAL